MTCQWCGSWQGVRVVRTHLQQPLSRCTERSPFDPTARCRRERGHLGRCTTEAPSTEALICYRCFGVWKETGERPPRYRMRDPAAGPITGRPLDLSSLRRGRGQA